MKTIVTIFALLIGLSANGAQQWVGIGATNNDGTGVPLRVGGQLINSNFTELFSLAFTNGIQQLGVSNDTVKPLVLRTGGTNQVFALEGNLTMTPTSIVVNASGGGSPGGNNDEVQVKNGAAFAGAGGVVIPTGRTNISMSGELLAFRAAISNTVTIGRAHTNTGDYSVISGGETNRSEGPWNVIAGGRNNRILGSDPTNAVSVIGGGEDNIIPLGNNKHAVIGGGQSNVIQHGRYSGILSGWVNKIGPSMSASNAVICGGFKNTNNAWNSFLGGGYTNQIHEVANDFVANVLVGGGFNYLKGSYSVLCGGSQNMITNKTGSISDGEGDFIGAGRANYIDGHKCGIVSGHANAITNSSFYSFIGAGLENRIDTSGSCVIVGGSQNKIESDADFSFIAGGGANWIGTSASRSSINGYLSKVADFTTDAYIIGYGITNATAFSVEAGVDDTTKTRFDAAGLLALGTIRGSGGANIAGNANLNFVYVTNNNALLLTTRLVATNSTVNSNITMNVNVGVLDLIITNNISVTNFSNLEAGTSKTVTWHIYPTLVNRTVVWPTLGAAGYGVRWYTNANAPMWTTLTQGVMYVASFEWRNTNCWPSISEWK